ncbi:hypothetical protein K431DRAFT_285755 [Polychaeton citri CBS 116435]|uniref:Uncharacterized protein n=1 Tax=Polychaeton citri CBS 116435 TaxID=1314669 RepID=A0A9P4Q931_9PEZI|nr:hypothetical protein K431DRAFT_285755 [Polychaeton citri CBS 116435]
MSIFGPAKDPISLALSYVAKRPAGGLVGRTLATITATAITTIATAAATAHTTTTQQLHRTQAQASCAHLASPCSRDLPSACWTNRTVGCCAACNIQRTPLACVQFVPCICGRLLKEIVILLLPILTLLQHGTRWASEHVHQAVHSFMHPCVHPPSAMHRPSHPHPPSCCCRP